MQQTIEAPMEIRFTYSVSTQQVVDAIDATTTPQKFEQLRLANPMYGIGPTTFRGRSAIDKALSTGNFELAKYIFQDPVWLNAINPFTPGRTPLITVSMDRDLKKGYVWARELIDLGANVNMCALAQLGVPEEYSCHEFKLTRKVNISPLWAAAQVSQNAKLTALFLTKGAICQPDPHPHYQEFIEKIKSLLYTPLLLCCAMHDEEWTLANLPAEVVKEIVQIYVEQFFDPSVEFPNMIR
jgi:hypothetical protein